MKAGLLVVCIVAIVLGDVFTSFAFNLGLPFYNFGAVIKTPIEFICLILLYKYNKFNSLYIILGILLVCWLIGFSVTYINYGGIRDASYGLEFEGEMPNSNPFFTSFNILSKYFLFFALMPMFLLHENNPSFVGYCRKIFEGFQYANTIAIIIGFIFGIQFFSSYNAQGNLATEARFGYKGLLYGVNETTGIFFLGIAYAYRELFVHKKNKIVLLLLLLGSSFLTGTKGAILASALLTGYYLFTYKRNLFYAVSVPTVAGLIWFVIQYDVFQKLAPLFNIYFNQSEKSTLSTFLTFFMTGRNDYIYYNWLYMESHWNILNYLFGDGVLYSETDLLDLYYFFGIGAIIYLAVYTILIFYRKLPDLGVVYSIFLLIAFTGGHVIRSGVFPVFLCLFLVSGYPIFYSKEQPVIK